MGLSSRSQYRHCRLRGTVQRMLGSHKMNREPRRRPSNQAIRPVAWYSLPYWAYRTAVFDWRNYRADRRPLTWRRISCSWRPKLARPIFLIGAPRTGTTFLGRCLGELPEISYHFEPIATKLAARCVYEYIWDTAKCQRFYRRVYTWLLRIHLDGDLVFAEKTPRNAFIVSFLNHCFPDARFIHILRDGRDAALSLSERPWLQAAEEASLRRETGGYRYGPFARFWVEADRRDEFETTSDIRRCIWSWRRHTQAALASGAELPPEQYHELRYESMVTDPQATADALLDFLDIRQEQSRASFHQALAGANCDSVGRWRNHLSEGALEEITVEAGSLLRSLGYSVTTGTEGHGRAV